MESYDVVVLGGGPGGYAAAIRSSRLGMRTAIIEKDQLGGTCLHRGCIPSKALLRSAEVYDSFKRADQFGIRTAGVELDFAAVLGRKDAIVRQLHEGVRFLMKKNKIDVIEGYGEIEDSGQQSEGGTHGTIAVRGGDGGTTRLAYRDLIIATGSRPRWLEGLAKHERIMTSDDALKMTEIPASIIIVGGGAIGVEWASLLRDFGSSVTIVEAAERLVPLEDEDVSRELQRLLAKRKISVLTGVRLLEDGIAADDHGVTVTIERKTGTVEALKAERVLVSVGRSANLAGFGLERSRVRTERGAIVVDGAMRTDDPHVYAVGDVVGGLQLAHVASREGAIAAEQIAGRGPLPIDPLFVPKCIYGRPEIASIGWTEKAAIAQGISVRSGKVSFKAIGKALVYGEADGFVKIVADTDSGTVIGVHMIGPHVTELIGQAGMAQILQATAEQMGSMIYAHPTLYESLGDAVMEWL